MFECRVVRNISVTFFIISIKSLFEHNSGKFFLVVSLV